MGDGVPELSVVIVNHNGAAFIERCLAAVLAQEVQGDFEVLVVDNASTDGSPELVRDRFPSVRVLRSSRNLGFAAGCNTGMRAAAGRFLVLLNTDAYPRAGCLAALRAAVLSDDRAAAVTAKLVFADRPGVIQNAGVLLLTDGGGADRGAGEEDGGQYGLREEVFGFCGAAALLRRDALSDTGGFDERFFMYYEDTDLSWRLRLRGWRIVYEPAAVVDHVHTGTSAEWSDFFTFHADRNRLLTLLKCAPPGMLLRSVLAISRRGAAGAGSAQHQLRRGLHTRVALSLLRLLPHALVQRLRIRLRRRVPDSEWKKLLYPRELWEARAR